jgi:glutaminyl-tRNA synthetase
MDDIAEGKDYKDYLNPFSMQLTKSYLEPELAKLRPGVNVQFERMGYFVPDKDSRTDRLIFNRTVMLKDTWAKVAAKQ